MTILSSLPGLGAFTAMGIHRTWAYRSRLTIWLLRNMLMLFMLRMVWTSVYGDQDEVNGIPIEKVLVYITIAMLQNYLVEPVAMFELDLRIQRGTIATDMIRPIGVIPQLFAYDFGFMVARIPMVMVILPVAAFIGSLRPPASVEAGIGYAISLFLAYVLGLLVWLPVGMLGFWTLNSGGFRFMLFSLMGLLSGQMIPLWLLPDWLRASLEFLPFQGMVFTPLAIYVGEISGSGIFRAMAVQTIWIVVMGLFMAWLWSRARNIVQVQGG